MKSLDRMGWNVPIVSHWGPAGGRFTELAGPSAPKVHFVQTYSFSGKLSPKGEAVLAALKAKYPEIKALARRDAGGRHRQRLRRDAPDGAGDRQGRLDRRRRRSARRSTRSTSYEGLIKTYAKPFTPTNHDALTSNDYIFTHFKDDQILPLTN